MMTQMNALLLDSGQATEKSGLFSDMTSGSSGEKSEKFAAFMADEQANKSGNTRQETAREKAESASKMAVASNNEKADLKNSADEKVAIETQDNKEADVDSDVKNTESGQEVIDGSEKLQADENTVDKHINSEVQHTRGQVNADAAEELLAFIKSSERVSTDHDNAKETSKRMDAIELAMRLSSNSVAVDGEKVEELAAKEQKLADEVQLILDGKKITRSSQSFEENSAKFAEKSTLEEREASIKNAALEGKAKEETKQNTVENIDKLMSKVDKQSGEKSDVAQKIQLHMNSKEQTAEVDDSSVGDFDVEETAPLDFTTSNVNNSSKSEEKSENTESKARVNTESLIVNEKLEVDETAVQKLSELSPKSVQEVAASVQNKEPATRPVNQATASIVNIQSDASSSAKQESSHDQSQSTEQDVLMQQGEQKQETSTEKVSKQFNEQLNAAGQVKSSETSILSERLTLEQEQSVQSVMAKSQADSISVQSTKSAQIIAQDTIAINRKDFSVAVKEKVMVMINQKLRQLEIRLDPPELGSMQVKVNLQNEQAVVSFVVQNTQAKDALEQHMGKLKDMLAESGVDVGDANIEQRDSQSASDEQFAQNSSGGSSDFDDESSLEQNIPAANLYKASSTGVDYYA